MKHNTTSKTISEQKWHFIDVEGKTLGRVSTEIAKLLMGKNKADYLPNQLCGDVVVVTNAEKIIVTGNKLEDKMYFWHTSFPRGLRNINLGKLMKTKPTEALRRSVLGMLPKNKLQNERIKNLHIYVGPEHPHKGQQTK